MSQEMRCGDPAALAGYLYDEIDPGERAAVERHLAACEICASEMDGLRTTRTQIAAWTPPDAQLGFRIVADSDTARVPSNVVPMRTPSVDDGRGVMSDRRTTQPWWQWSALPAWAQAAAAVMLFALGGVVAAMM